MASVASDETVTTCASCKKAITSGSAFIKALGQNYHVDHFTCTKCGEILGSGSFHEHQGVPYCRKDYYEQFVSKCKLCNEYIEGPMIIALGGNWHYHHFVCTFCSNAIAAGEFHVLIPSNEPCCPTCFSQNVVSPICCACRIDVRTEDLVEVPARKLHRACFKCEACNVILSKETWKEFQGKAYCKEHYYSARAAPCERCNLAISATRLLYKDKEYHIDCFACKTCHKKLAKPSDSEIVEPESCAVLDRDIYCTECLRKLTAATSTTLASSLATVRNSLTEKHEELFNILTSAEEIVPTTASAADAIVEAANALTSSGTASAGLSGANDNDNDVVEATQSTPILTLEKPSTIPDDEPLGSLASRGPMRGGASRVSMTSNQRSTWHPDMAGVNDGLAELDKALEVLSLYARTESYGSSPAASNTGPLASSSAPSNAQLHSTTTTPASLPVAPQPAAIYADSSKKEVSTAPAFPAPQKPVVEDVANIPVNNQHYHHRDPSPFRSRSPLRYLNDANSSRGYLSANVSRSASISSQTSLGGGGAPLPRARDAINRGNGGSLSASSGRPMSMYALGAGSAPPSSRPSFSGPSATSNSNSSLTAGGASAMPYRSGGFAGYVKPQGTATKAPLAASSSLNPNSSTFSSGLSHEPIHRSVSLGTGGGSESHGADPAVTSSSAPPPLSSSWFARVEQGRASFSSSSSPSGLRRSTLPFSATASSPSSNPNSTPSSPKPAPHPVPKAEVEYQYSELVKRPFGVNLVALESHLSDSEFERELTVRRSEFYTLPAWKQKKLKENARLF